MLQNSASICVFVYLQPKLCASNRDTLQSDTSFDPGPKHFPQIAPCIMKSLYRSIQQICGVPTSEGVNLSNFKPASK